LGGKSGDEYWKSRTNRKWEEKKSRENDGKWILRKKVKVRKFGFSRENAAENILQGEYQINSDTMLGNMISNEGMRENSNNLCIDDKVNIRNEWINPLVGCLQLYILLVLFEAKLYL